RPGGGGGARAPAKEAPAVPAAEEAAAAARVSRIVLLIAALITALVRVALEPREEAGTRRLGARGEGDRSASRSGEKGPASPSSLPFQHKPLPRPLAACPR